MTPSSNDLVDRYMYPPSSGEINLVAEARRLLVEAGIGAGIAIFDQDPNVCFAANTNSNVQRFKLNTFLDTQYMSLHTDVTQERSMLLDSGSPQNWLQMFKDYHIPALKAMGLPRAYPV